MQRALHDTLQHFSMGGGPATDGRIIYYIWSQVFARALSFLSCQPLKYTRTQMLSECPLSHPFSNEFSCGLVPFLVRLFV